MSVDAGTDGDVQTALRSEIRAFIKPVRGKRRDYVKLHDAPTEGPGEGFALTSTKDQIKLLERRLDGKWGSYRLFEKWLHDAMKWQWIDLQLNIEFANRVDQRDIVQDQAANFLDIVDKRLAQLWAGRASALQTHGVAKAQAYLEYSIQRRAPTVVHPSTAEIERSCMTLEDHLAAAGRFIKSDVGTSAVYLASKHPKHTVKNVRDFESVLDRADELLVMLKKDANILEDSLAVRSEIHTIEKRVQEVELSAQLVKTDAADKESAAQKALRGVENELKSAETKLMEEKGRHGMAIALEEKLEEEKKKLHEAHSELDFAKRQTANLEDQRKILKDRIVETVTERKNLQEEVKFVKKKGISEEAKRVEEEKRLERVLKEEEKLREKLEAEEAKQRAKQEKARLKEEAIREKEAAKQRAKQEKLDREHRRQVERQAVKAARAEKQSLKPVKFGFFGRKTSTATAAPSVVSATSAAVTIRDTHSMPPYTRDSSMDRSFGGDTVSQIAPSSRRDDYSSQSSYSDDDSDDGVSQRSQITASASEAATTIKPLPLSSLPSHKSLKATTNGSSLAIPSKAQKSVNSSRGAKPRKSFLGSLFGSTSKTKSKSSKSAKNSKYDDKSDVSGISASPSVAPSSSVSAISPRGPSSSHSFVPNVVASRVMSSPSVAPQSLQDTMTPRNDTDPVSRTLHIDALNDAMDLNSELGSASVVEGKKKKKKGVFGRMAGAFKGSSASKSKAKSESSSRSPSVGERSTSPSPPSSKPPTSLLAEARTSEIIAAREMESVWPEEQEPMRQSSPSTVDQELFPPAIPAEARKDSDSSAGWRPYTRERSSTYVAPIAESPGSRGTHRDSAYSSGSLSIQGSARMIGAPEVISARQDNVLFTEESPKQMTDSDSPVYQELASPPSPERVLSPHRQFGDLDDGDNTGTYRSYIQSTERSSSQHTPDDAVYTDTDSHTGQHAIPLVVVQPPPSVSDAQEYEQKADVVPVGTQHLFSEVGGGDTPSDTSLDRLRGSPRFGFSTNDSVSEVDHRRLSDDSLVHGTAGNNGPSEHAFDSLGRQDSGQQLHRDALEAAQGLLPVDGAMMDTPSVGDVYTDDDLHDDPNSFPHAVDRDRLVSTNGYVSGVAELMMGVDDVETYSPLAADTPPAASESVVVKRVAFGSDVRNGSVLSDASLSNDHQHSPAAPISVRSSSGTQSYSARETLSSARSASAYGSPTHGLSVDIPTGDRTRDVDSRSGSGSRHSSEAEHGFAFSGDSARGSSSGGYGVGSARHQQNPGSSSEVARSHGDISANSNAQKQQTPFVLRITAPATTDLDSQPREFEDAAASDEDVQNGHPAWREEPQLEAGVDLRYEDDSNSLVGALLSQISEEDSSFDNDSVRAYLPVMQRTDTAKNMMSHIENRRKSSHGGQYSVADVIKYGSPFIGANAQERDQLLERLMLVQTPAHTVLKDTREPLDSLLIIETGRVNIIDTTTDDVIDRLTDGDLIFEEQFVRHEYYQHKAVTASACIMWKLSKSTYDSVMNGVRNRLNQEFAQTLRSIRLLRNLTQEEALDVAATIQLAQHPPGKTIVEQTDVGKCTYIVYSGSCMSTAADGSSFRYGVGEWFGQMTLLHPQKYKETVVVNAEEEKFVVGVLRRDFVEEVCGEDVHSIHSRAAAGKTDKGSKERKGLSKKKNNPAKLAKLFRKKGKKSQRRSMHGFQDDDSAAAAGGGGRDEVRGDGRSLSELERSMFDEGA
eukprot:Lankesteria_metandrocarpae@DN2091_c0_g1_i1.p1